MFPGMGGMGGGMALNQLLVQMDGVDEPPFFRKVFTKRFNTFLDATYVVPQRLGRLRCASARPSRARADLLHRRDQRPIDALDPALIRPGRMGRHIWFRTPTKDDRQDIFDLYLGKVDHEPGPRHARAPRRARAHDQRLLAGDDRAGLLDGADLRALRRARQAFDRADIVEAMTTIESGTAVGVNYVEEETRAVAIHEAGHAVASHVYMQDVMSTRLSIRMRGNSLGHHQAIEKEERFSSWRHEEVGNLVWTLGAMAAEHVFYGENSVGVGGDIQSATWRVARMVGMSGMGPEPISLDPDDFPDEARATRPSARSWSASSASACRS